MKKIYYTLFALLCVQISSAAFAGSNCDERHPFTALSGQKLIDCRVNGAAAQARYNSLQAVEVYSPDADGGPGSFTKVDSYNYCFASYQKTTYQCSQTLDAATDKVLPLSAATTLSEKRGHSCAMTNGSDVCNKSTPCCEVGAVCSGEETGQGFCD